MQEYTPEEVAMIERASQDNAIKHALKLEATKVSTVLEQMIPTNFVIVRCPRTGYLFVKKMWVFKCYVNVLLLLPDIRCRPVHVSRSLLCGCLKQVFVCTLVDKVRGAPMWRLSPKIQTIQFNMVFFSFLLTS